MKDSGGLLNKLISIGKKRKILLLLVDTCIFAFACLLYCFLYISFGEKDGLYYGKYFLLNAILMFAVVVANRFLLKTYNNIWRYTDTKAYFFLVVSDFISGCEMVCISYFINLLSGEYYFSVWQTATIVPFCALGTLMSRFSYRLLYKRFSKLNQGNAVSATKIPVAIIGAGHLGAYLAKELVNSPKSKYEPKCFIDCDKAKVGNMVSGLTVVSNSNIAWAMNKYAFTEVIVAVANLDGERYKEIWNLYNSLGCKVKIYDFQVDERDPWTKKNRIIRDFSIEDLLFRKPLEVGGNNEFEYYRGKRILVTGGGGSIGSELCRQIAKCQPAKLIIFDIYENNAYDIQQELIRIYSDSLNLEVEIGSVRDVKRLDCVFANHRPDVVFHAAAHKHVPLMEHSGCEAIKNNVLGTYNTANMAEKYGVEKFILVSTDKAVNPTNIMGASKRLCEMVIQCRTDSDTVFAAVRFGNVLGSNGSVIPLFKRQILSGGPVTITDKRIIRYFMTIPEASQLVMAAGAKARRGELFVLDMGQPGRIYDLATNMIKLMGYAPGVDIMIEEIGLRPGEKLYEELLMKNEELVETDNKMIFVEKDKPYSRVEVEEKLEILKAAVEESKDVIGSAAIKEAIKKTVPTFIDPEAANASAEFSDEMKNVKKELVNV